MYLITLYFDEKTNRILDRLILEVAHKTGNDFMIKNQVPPHMTISQIEARSERVLLPTFEKMNDKLKATTISFVSVGMFVPYVAYATPIMNDGLLTLSKQVHDSFVQIDETTISKYYKPMSWFPHVTLGKTLSKEEMLIAMDVLRERFVPFEGKVTKIGLSKVNPHMDIMTMSLLED